MRAVKTVSISIDEKLRRKAAIDGANASMRLEGFVLSKDEKARQEKFINGEITLEEYTAIDPID